MTDGTNFAAEQLHAIIERVEACEGVIASEQEARKEIYAEAKSGGLDPKIIRKLVALRKKRQEIVKKEAELLSLYASAIQYDLGF